MCVCEFLLFNLKLVSKQGWEGGDDKQWSASYDLRHYIDLPYVQCSLLLLLWLLLKNNIVVIFNLRYKLECLSQEVAQAAAIKVSLYTFRWC